MTKAEQTFQKIAAQLHGLHVKEHVTEKDVNAKQLAMGMKVEMEHTDKPEVAKLISLDHLTEIPDYYTRLAKMEREAKK